MLSLMKITFTGVGGTRRVMARQYPPFYTGGFRIESSGLNFYVDPGPGAVLRSAELGYKVEETDILILSHKHLDHTSDANVIGQSMNGYGFKRRGMLIGSKSILESPSNYPYLFPFVANSFLEIHTPPPQETLMLSHNYEDFTFTTTRVDHSDETGWGFILEMEGKRVGYTSDTRWFDGLGKQFRGVDLLIANITNIGMAKRTTVHLRVEDMENLLEESEVSRLSLYHLSESIIHYGRDKLLAELKDKYELSYGVDIHIPISGYEIKV
ncbi:MAG: hypothetical protein D6769_03745 [Methanobacteriota archaeon]|nr:MAG: hypothetical protein D6769_03745 [Euryarchaeota archaeon]